MNDKKFNEIITAVSETSLGDKVIKTIKSKVDGLNKATGEYTKAQKEHKAAFLKFSAERTKLETLQISIEQRISEVELLEVGIKEREAACTSRVTALKKREDEFYALERKAKADIKRNLTKSEKSVRDADALHNTAQLVKGEYESKLKQLTDIVNG